MNAISSYMPLIVFIASIGGSAIGMYIGMKIGLTKLETWQQYATADYNKMRKDVDIVQDDCNTFDMEIGDILRRQGVERIRRQMVRP